MVLVCGLSHYKSVIRHYSSPCPSLTCKTRNKVVSLSGLMITLEVVTKAVQR